MVSPAHMMMALASQEGLQLCVGGQEEEDQHTPLQCSAMDCDGGEDELCHYHGLLSPGGKLCTRLYRCVLRPRRFISLGSFTMGIVLEAEL